MIEKFTDEELKQIMRELGMSANCSKVNICGEEILELNELWREKPQEKSKSKHTHIFAIIDITLCNFKKQIRKERWSRKEYETYSTTSKIKQEIKEEYKQMFQEILEIIKKHNRKWEMDCEKSE